MALPFGVLLFFAGVVWSRRRLAKSRSLDEERRRRTARESGVLDRDFVSAIIPDLELLEVAQHGQSGRLGGGTSGHRDLARHNLKALGRPQHA